MIVQTSILINDNKTMLDVCGVNNRNIRRIESLTDIAIEASGEEIILSGNDFELVELLINNLIDISKNNGMIYTNLIDLMVSELKHDSSTNFNDMINSSINIAKANKVFNPRTVAQGQYINLLNKKDVVLAYGPAGTGKTFLSICYAVNQLLNKEVEKIVITRPIVEAGESLGFLPGDYIQKINPYLIPLFDSLNQILSQEMYLKLTAKNAIEIAPLAYMRGRTFENAIVILDEAQNTTCSQMKMFLTRLGNGAKLRVNGDITQIDLPFRVKSGMVDALSVLRGIEEIGFMEFSEKDVVRHPIVKKIISAYNKNGN